MIGDFFGYNTCATQICGYADKQISFLKTSPFSLCILWRSDALNFVHSNVTIFYILDGDKPFTIIAIVLCPATRTRCKKRDVL